MTRISRRTALTGAAGAGALAAAGIAPPAAAEAAELSRRGDVIGPGDARYLTLRTGNNQRYVATPDYIKMIRSTADAEAALREALRAGKRVSVRSGGHCFTDFVCHPEVEVILDFSEMTGVEFDPKMNAFMVEPGARLMNVYEALYSGWGVTLPGGVCWNVGIGGHVQGGGYGLLSRAHGLVCDHLYAVELIVADRPAGGRTIVATRDANDPHRDLWWAHTGGGGGNFGLVTRYWFRSPGAQGRDPHKLLPSPPSQVLLSALEIPWDGLSKEDFVRLLKNFGSWHEKNSSPDSPYANLSCLFNVDHQANETMGVFTQVDGTRPDGDRLLSDYLDALMAGTSVTPQAMTRPSGELVAMPQLATPRRLPWLKATRLVGTNNPTITNPTARAHHKSAYMRQGFTDHMIDALHKGMTRPDFHNPDTMLVLIGFGGQVNAVPPGATANAQRDSVFKMCFQTFWEDADDDTFYLSWIRDLYADFFAETKGVPVTGGRTDGCYINYPDRDLNDPEFNTSGVPYTELYYKDNYPRLQQVKKRYDPGNVLRHSLSIEPAS